MTAPADHPKPAPDPLAADGSTIANIAPAPTPLPLVSGDAPPTSAAALPAFPGMQILAIFIFRITYKHFEHHRSWPLALALAGDAAMAAAMISLTWRAKKGREGIM